MIKKLLGLAPKREPDGAYSPSKVALMLATSSTTDYREEDYPESTKSRRKILTLFTEQKNMTMKNGKQFSTGNHPVEALVPLLHLRDAGFEITVATPTGLPAVLEMWAFPESDVAVKEIYSSLKSALERPVSLNDFTTDLSEKTATYAAVFIPGGHGAMLGLPEDENVAKVLGWAHDNELFTVSICHGPAALLASTLNDQHFLYAGYELAVFPDSVDEKTPLIGYLPGPMPRPLSEHLKDLGAKVINTKADDTVCLDRRLITGASPAASNKLGVLAAKTLLAAF